MRKRGCLHGSLAHLCTKGQQRTKKKRKKGQGRQDRVQTKISVEVVTIDGVGEAAVEKQKTMGPLSPR